MKTLKACLRGVLNAQTFNRSLLVYDPDKYVRRYVDTRYWDKCMHRAFISNEGERGDM